MSDSDEEECTEISECRINREQMGSITLRQLFVKNAHGKYILFDNKERRSDTLVYSIPNHQRHPKWNKSQMNNLIFAFNICRFVKSNAIVLASNETTTGIGSGQPSRLDSCQIAIDKMKKFADTKDEIVAASDAFFPFVDGIEKLVQSGVTAVIQPSGSIRDKEIIRYANETDTILVFSKTRHFRH